MGRVLLYVLSLPERVIRTIVGWIGRIVLVTLGLLPQRLRQTRLYRIAIAKQLRVLTDTVGGAAPDADELATPQQDYVPRKIVGSTADSAMIAFFHVSPLWVLLALADVIDGAADVTKSIVTALKAEGLIRPESKVRSLDDVLEAVSDLTGRLAQTIDAPPLSKEQLRETIGLVRRDATAVRAAKHLRAEELRECWDAVLDTAEETSLPVEQVASVVGARALTQLGWRTRLPRSLAVIGQTTANIAYAQLIRSYIDDMRAISQSGFRRTAYGTVQPQVAATVRNFSIAAPMWTEIALTLGRVRHWS